MTGNVAELCFRAEDEVVGVSQEIGRPVAGGSFAARPYAFSSTWILPRVEEGLWASDIGFRVVYDNNRALPVFEAIGPIP
jgi:hypothetical protein